MQKDLTWLLVNFIAVRIIFIFAIIFPKHCQVPTENVALSAFLYFIKLQSCLRQTSFSGQEGNNDKVQADN